MNITTNEVKKKPCNKCNEVLPCTTEHFYRQKDGKYGFQSYCKCCKNKYFKGNLKVKQYQKEYAQENKQHLSAYRKEYREDNRKHLLEYFRAKYRDNKEWYSIKGKEYRENNKEIIKTRSQKYRQTTRARKLEKVRQWRRVTVKKRLEATFTLQQWEECKDHFNNCCAYCGKKKKLEQDHFIAITNNGEYTKNNIVPACRSCNASKSNNNFFKWYPKQSCYSEKREKTILRYLNYSKNNEQQLTLVF